MNQYYNHHVEAALNKLAGAEVHHDQHPSLVALAKLLKNDVTIKGEIFTFGSMLNGFGTIHSDIDCVFISDSKLDTKALITKVDRCIRRVKNGQFRVEAAIKHARVPIIKIKDLDNKIELDMSFDNIYAIVNSQLIYCYAQIHPKIKIIGRLLKLWGKRQRIINSSMLSSYLVVLMLIHFLQAKFKLPNLQDHQYMPESKIQAYKDLQNSLGFDSFFVCDANTINHLSQDAIELLDKTSLQELLYQFWLYYQYDGQFQRKDIFIQINGTEERYENNPFSCIDPFNQNHDPGSRVRQCLKTVEKEFRYALQDIDSNEPNLKVLF